MARPWIVPGLLLAMPGPVGAVPWREAAAPACQEAPTPAPALALPDRMPGHARHKLRYEIEARLAEDRHTIRATERVTWRNPAAVATSELLWHVYNNAWSGRDSVWLQESRLYGNEQLPRAWGGTAIESVRRLGDAPVDLRWGWAPPESAPGDRTVMRVELPEPVGPGGEVVVEVVFTAELPPAFRRSGYGSDGYVHAVQWYPKVGVFEELDGEHRWNCEPYRYLAEFYSDYADYRLDLTLPAGYLEGETAKVAASGSLVGAPSQNGDGTATFRFEAEDIHDFAWTADPDFVVVRRQFDGASEPFRDAEEEARVAAALGREIGAVQPAPTEIILMLQPEHREYEERYLDATAKSLYYYGLWYGSYPYPTVSVIDPAHDARRTGGMEYPRLFTGGVRKGNAERTLSPEGITVHEFGHQFWYGLVGNDEFRHAWLDEGLNSYSTARVLAAGWEPSLGTYSVLGRQFYGRAPGVQPAYGSGDFRGLLTLERLEVPELFGQRPFSLPLRRRTALERWFVELPEATYLPEVVADPVEGQRRVHAQDFSEPMSRPAYALLSDSMRGVNAYRRPALTLETMARLMRDVGGEARWTRLMRAYHERWRFRHPRPEDFFEVVKEFGTGAAVGGVPVDWPDFWQQAYFGNERMDFGVHRLVNQPAVADPRALPPEAGTSEEAWDVIVEVRRYGGFRVPVEIEIGWDDGSATREVWDGQDWWWRHRAEASPVRATRVVVDPDRRLLLDRNWLNNARSAVPDRGRAARVGLRALIWTQQVLHYFGGVG